MKRNICLQSTLRQRVRTLFLLLLVGLISFAFISRAVEYLVVDRETDRLAGYYRAIGNFVPIDPDNVWFDPSQGAEEIAKSPYVALDDRRRYCSGVLQGIYNADIDGIHGTPNNEIFVYGVLRSKLSLPGWYQFELEVYEMSAGYPEYEYVVNSRIKFRHFSEARGDLDDIYAALQIGQRYFVKGLFHLNQSRESNTFILKPLDNSALWFLPAEPGESVNPEEPSLAGLAEGLQVLEENLRTMQVISTKDMSAIPAVQESSRDYYLAEGRWLNRIDDVESRQVCVVHRDFAEMRNLSVGDTISLELRDLKDSPSGYICYGDADWGPWQDYETHIEEFEIVGLYIRPDYTHSWDSCWMFIPDSAMPAGFGDRRRLEGGAYYHSFVLRSPLDGEAFLAETREALAELGLTATLIDTGWDNFQSSATSIKQSAALNAGIFTLVLVLALALAAFLYLRQRRRDFAILRSLGVSKSTASRQMLQPMALVGAMGILFGGLIAWYYALSQATGTLASLQGPEGVAPSTALSPLWLAGLSAGVFALLLLYTYTGISLTARSPVLELLQNTAARAAGRGKGVTESEENPVATREMQSAPPVPLALGKAPAAANNLGLAQSSRYVLQHIRRAPLKSMLTMVVALSFTLALGWMNWTMESNEADLDRLYRSIQVEAEIINTSSQYTVRGFIGRQTVDAVLRSGFVQSAYLDAAASTSTVASVDDEGKWDGTSSAKSFRRGFNQADQFFSDLGKGKDAVVEYGDGWDQSLFAREWFNEQEPPVVLPASLVTRLSLQLGDPVLISNRGVMHRYTVAGKYTGPIYNDSEPILFPHSVLEQLQRGELLYAEAKFVFDPALNRELPQFKAEMKTLIGNSGAGTVPLTFLFWDEELTQVVEPLEKNLSLMEILLPVTVSVSVLIAAGLAALLMFQAAREASIMRVLGTTKGRARAMLCGEQLFLCLIGLFLGLALLMVLRQDAVAVLAGPALVCAALYLAGVICGSIPSAVSVTNRMPLELLQVKE